MHQVGTAILAENYCPTNLQTTDGWMRWFGLPRERTRDRTTLYVLQVMHH